MTKKNSFTYDDLMSIDWVCQHLEQIHAVDSVSWEKHMTRLGAYVYSKFHAMSDADIKALLAS